MKGRTTPTMLWEKIIRAYDGLPEDERTILRVASELEVQGQRVPASRVGRVLKETVLEDMIEPRELETTGKVLRALVDLTISVEHPDWFSGEVSDTVGKFLDGLPWEDH